MNNSIVIAKNVPLTSRLKGAAIWVSKSADITIFTSQFGPAQPIPDLTTQYLDHLCCKFYFGGITRQYPIADILLLNNLLARSEYDDFYYCLGRTLDRKSYTVISSLLFR